MRGPPCGRAGVQHSLNRAESSGGVTRLQHYSHHGCNFAVSRDEIMTSELYDRLAAAGLKRQVVSKVWNKDQFRISVVFEYSSKDAFEKCREIFGELERSEFMNKFAVKFQNNRGVVISDFEA